MMLRRHGFVVALALSMCGAGAASQDRAPYDFNGIRLDSSEAELPEEYKAVTSNCSPDRQGSTPVKHCEKDFPSHSLPGLDPDVKGPIHFGLHYIRGRLQQISIIFPREDYAAFVAMLKRRHGAPTFVQSVEYPMERIKETEYTWTICIRGRGRFSIATYALDTSKMSRVQYVVVTHDPLCPYRAP